METLAHIFVLNGTRYDTALSAVLNEWAPTQNFWYLGYVKEGPAAFIIFKTIGLSAINHGENPYIHAALRIIKSLTIPAHYERDDLQVFRWFASGNRQQLDKFLRRSKRNICRIQRELRLRKLQNGIRGNSYESYSNCAWNRDLVSKLLIPILDYCPKSNELLALIHRRMRLVILKYMTRRRLRDAVYRYIRRTSDIG